MLVKEYSRDHRGGDLRRLVARAKEEGDQRVYHALPKVGREEDNTEDKIDRQEDCDKLEARNPFEDATKARRLGLHTQLQRRGLIVLPIVLALAK